MKYNSSIVHGAGVKDNGSLPEIGKERMETGLKLYFNNEAGKLIFTGGYINPKSPVSCAGSMKEYASKRGVDEQDILLEERAADTIGDIFYSKIDYLKPNGWNKNVVVSSDFHLPRIKMICDKVFGENYYTKLVGSTHNLTKDEMRRFILREKSLQPLDRMVLSGIRSGDDTSIERRLDYFYQILDKTGYLK